MSKCVRGMGTGLARRSCGQTHGAKIPQLCVRPCPHPSLDGNNHSLWSTAVEIAKDDSGKKTRKPIYMRRVTSTAFQMAIDHTFTGTYVTRFTSRRTRDARVAPPPAPPNTSPTNATASPGSGLHQASITSPPTTPVGFLPKTFYSTLHAIS